MNKLILKTVQVLVSRSYLTVYESGYLQADFH